MNERAQTILSNATLTQVQWVVARLTSKSDAIAAKKVGVANTTVSDWANKAELDEAVNLLLLEGAESALLILKHGAAQAAKVVVDALKSKNIDARLRAATIILGKQLPDKAEVDLKGQFIKMYDKVSPDDWDKPSTLPTE